MSNVIKFYPENASKDPDFVLEQAMDNYSDVIILGWDKNEDMDVRITQGMKLKEIVWLLEKFKHKLLNGDYSE